MLNKMKIQVNAAKLKVSRKLKTEKAWGMPSAVQIEVSNRCNCSCIMCNIEEMNKLRPPKFLSMQEVKGILDQFPYVKHVALAGLGEPLLNPHIIDMVDLCTQRGIKSEIFTNAMLLSKDKIRLLTSAGLAHLNISIDSTDPKLFSQIRRGADLETVVENVKEIIAFKKDHISKKTSVRVIAVATKENVHQLTNIVQLAFDLEVDAITVKKVLTDGDDSLVIPEGSQQFQADLLRLKENLLQKRPEFEILLAFAYGNRNNGKNLNRTLCQFPWSTTYITSEGEVTPCCAIPNAKNLSFGNVFTGRFDSMWNGKAYRDFRKNLKKRLPAVCRHCDIL
jgi:MoaA/NifB/PqqE/SkfB family radical SAM enzyme